MNESLQPPELGVLGFRKFASKESETPLAFKLGLLVVLARLS